jgi:hypothetical protein
MEKSHAIEPYPSKSMSLIHISIPYFPVSPNTRAQLVRSLKFPVFKYPDPACCSFFEISRFQIPGPSLLFVL